jgi:hypothetical protein
MQNKQKIIAVFLKSGDELLDLSQEKNLLKIARSLAVPDALADLAYNGQAAEGVAIIKALPPTDQQNILTVTSAVWGLAYNGQAAAVMSIIEAWPTVAQKAVIKDSNLAQPYAGWALADNGQMERLKKIRSNWAKAEVEQKSSARPFRLSVAGIVTLFLRGSWGSATFAQHWGVTSQDLRR